MMMLLVLQVQRVEYLLGSARPYLQNRLIKCTLSQKKFQTMIQCSPHQQLGHKSVLVLSDPKNQNETCIFLSFYLLVKMKYNQHGNFVFKIKILYLYQSVIVLRLRLAK